MYLLLFLLLQKNVFAFGIFSCRYFGFCLKNDALCFFFNALFSNAFVLNVEQ